MRHRTWISLCIGLALLAGLAAALMFKAKAPPEAARLLPECDAIVYVQLHTLRSATHFGEMPVARSADYQRFIDATGIVPERDLDAVAMAFHRLDNPHGPNGPVAYSEVFTGNFDGARLADYLHRMAASEEIYAGHTVYSLPIEGRILRVAQLGYDTIGASNTPTTEAIHSMLDREHAGALAHPGSSLLATRFRDVPLLSQAWGIGHIGLPFAQAGHVSLLGLELPLPADTDFVASLRYAGTLKLRIEEIAPNADAAARTVSTMSALLDLVRGLGAATMTVPAPQAVAVKDVLASVSLQQNGSRAVLTANASDEDLRSLARASAAPPAPALSSAP